MKKITKNIGAIKDKSVEFEREVREKTFGYIVASFSLVAGLAWNDAIKGLIEEFFPLAKDTIKAKFSYAVLITLIVVFVSIHFARFFKKPVSKEEVDSKKEKDSKK